MDTKPQIDYIIIDIISPMEEIYRFFVKYIQVHCMKVSFGLLMCSLTKISINGEIYDVCAFHSNIVCYSIKIKPLPLDHIS